MVLSAGKNKFKLEKMVKCPVCGTEAKVYSVSSTGEITYVCPHCGSRWTERKKFTTPQKESKEGEPVTKFSTSLFFKTLLFFAIIVASSMLILFSIIGTAQSFITQIFPDFPTFQYIPYLIVFGLGLYAAYTFAKKSMLKGLIYCIIFVIALLICSALIIEVPKVMGWFNQTLPSNVTDSGIPPAIKEGGYYTFNFKWGSEETNFEQRFPLPIRKDSETLYEYIFPITIENPSRKKSIKDFCLLPGTGLYNISDMLFQELYPALCTEDKKCEISPLDKYVISLSSKGEVNYKMNVIRIKVNTSLSTVNFGNNTFVFIKNRDYEKIAPVYQPYTGEGPIDITVYFAPVKYNFEYMTETEEIRVVIKLRNKQEGVGRIKKITIVRYGNLSLLKKPEVCQGVGGDYILSSENERSEYIQFSSPMTLASYPQTYLCDYIVPEEVRASKITSPFETVVFLVIVEYDYERMYEKEVGVTVLK